ncbi:MAG: hypothetical protein CSB55_07245 [Candidatus Cloacimonadota bacterium]|nr:MAG: hypothetical protein CSB55_07245 [Candidatus Cloacimonadota bacterium]
MKKTICFTLMFAILLGGCKFKEFFEKKKEKRAETEHHFTVKVPVTVSEAHFGSLRKHVKTDGIAKAAQRVEVTAELNEKIVWVKDCNNSFAEKGSVIVKLDNEQLLLDLEKAELNKRKAEAEFEAWKKLGENSSDEQLRLRTGLTEAEIALKRAQYNLKKTEIKAPVSGFISNLELVVGERIRNGDALFSVFNTNKIIVKANVLESEINRIKPKSKARIKFPGLKNKVFSGEVKSVSPEINESSRTCEVEILISDNALIKHGMYADVKIDAENYENRILVYKDALIVRDGKKLVFAVEDGKAKWQYVKTGEENENFISVTEGAEPGQKIVIKGNFSLSHDANVKIEEEIEFEKLARIF